MEEIWRDIYYFNEPTNEWIDYRGIYQVSNLGRIRSLDRYVRGFNHGVEFQSLIKGKIIKCRPNKYGYYLAHLSKEGKHRDYSLHRIVFFSFNPNADTSLEVNHINEVLADCRLINLNLLTSKENANWGTRSERVKLKISGVKKGPMTEEHKKKISQGNKMSEKMKRARKIIALKNAKPIQQFDKEGTLIKVYQGGAAQAERETGICSSSIQGVCSGDKHRHTAGGFIWKYLD